MMKYFPCIALIALFLLLSTASSASSSQIFGETENISFDVNRNGDAQVQFIITYLPSTFTDSLKIIYREADIEVLKNSTISAIRSSLSMYGWETTNFGYEITGLEDEGNLQILVTCEIAGISTRTDNLWRLAFEFVDPEDAAQTTIDQLKGVQAILLGFPGASMQVSSKTVFLLPEGAIITNLDELENAGEQTIDYGGGTSQQDNLHVEEIESRPAVITESVIFITTENITITPEELLQKYQETSCAIEYTGVSAEEGLSYLTYLMIGIVIIATVGISLMFVKRR